METNTAIVVMSCDDYSDTWPIFFKLKEKYWGLCPYKTYLVTENKEYNLCNTIKTHGAWTKRLREALQQIDTEFVILMLDDFFIRQPVDRYRIAQVINVFMKNRPWVANMSFEQEYAPTYASSYPGFRMKPWNSTYLNTCQPGVWRRDLLLERLQMDTDVWAWEESSPVVGETTHFVNGEDPIIDIGYKDGQWFGVRQGKWVIEDMLPLMIEEQFELPMDRGFCSNTKGVLSV